MGDNSNIEWTDATWNPIRGCRRTAAKGAAQSGCGDSTGGGCYAERQAARQCKPGQAYDGLVKLTSRGPRWTGKARLVPEHLTDPLRWRRPRRIFTDSMSDLFYEGHSDDVIDQVVAVMLICCLHERSAGHIFQTLTKRPRRMRAYFDEPGTQERVARAAGHLMEDGDGWLDMIAIRKEGLLHPRMWWGTSIENQEAAAERLPELAATRAAVRFLSVEPMLGPVNPASAIGEPDDEDWDVAHAGGDDADPEPDALAAECDIENDYVNFGADLVENPEHAEWKTRRLESAQLAKFGRLIHWVIIGCESGPRARACAPHWIGNLVAWCRASEVPVFLKQAVVDSEAPKIITAGPGSKLKRGGVAGRPYFNGQQICEFPKIAEAA